MGLAQGLTVGLGAHPARELILVANPGAAPTVNFTPEGL
jgi:hypothetical protein